MGLDKEFTYYFRPRTSEKSHLLLDWCVLSLPNESFFAYKDDGITTFCFRSKQEFVYFSLVWS